MSDVTECVREDFRQIRTVPSATAGIEEISKLGQRAWGKVI
jgi:hypothetical protein